jgi:hypothetical protein
MSFKSTIFVLILILCSFTNCYKISKTILKLTQNRCDENTDISADIAAIADINYDTISSKEAEANDIPKTTEDDIEVPTGTKAEIDILGSAAQFAVLGASTITSTGGSTIKGSMGVFPGTSITGIIDFEKGKVESHEVSSLAQNDALIAYNSLVNITDSISLQGTDLGGLTLAPGVYSFYSSAALSGTLFLDAKGDANAKWIFQIGSTLTASTGSKVVMINQGSALNVYWLIGSSATILANCEMSGNMLVSVSATFNYQASLKGRVLARVGAVTLDTNKIGLS